MQKVAFFDIDGTLFRSSLVVELVHALVKSGAFPEHVEEEYEESLLAWQNREESYDAYIRAVVQSFMRHIQGVHYGSLADAGREVIATQRNHVYRYTRDLITELKSRNYYLVAISQSPKTIVDEFCRQYAFDKVYGRMYEIGPQDKFTGEMIDVHLIENKANIVSRVFEQEGIIHEQSIAVGDTEGDIPMLDAVERPICFNPNLQLYTHATRTGWEVVVERKDVIYTL